MAPIAVLHARLVVTILLFFGALSIWGFFSYLRGQSISGSYKGGPFENPMFGVAAIDDHGRFVRVHAYDEKQLEEAGARLEELATDPAGDDANLAVRYFTQRAMAFNNRDWDLMATLYAADASYEDRRPVMRHEHQGG